MLAGIIKVIIIIFILGVIAKVFEKITGINLSGDDEKKTEEKKLSPLEQELKDISPGELGRDEAIAQYLIPLYNIPHVENYSFKASFGIYDLVTKYNVNQLLFAEEFENHVLIITGKAETIGLSGDKTYISMGNGRYYVNSQTTGGESVKQHIDCYINKSYMEDTNYKNLVMRLRPGVEVVLVGVLKVASYGKGFELLEAILISAGGIVPEVVMNIAENSIRMKYASGENTNS